MKLNRLCNLEHWGEPDLTAAMRELLPYFMGAYPNFPVGVEHRKHWEFAQILTGLRFLKAAHQDSWLLSVAGGHEETAYLLTNEARWVFLVDIYGAGTFTDIEAEASILQDPAKYARVPYNPRRLVVEYMNALDLRFEANTFDGLFCSSSIEHFGSVPAAEKALAEMHRVLKPGGIAAITTECIVDGTEPWITPTLILFSPAMLGELAVSIPGLDLIEPIDYSISPASMAATYSHLEAVEDAKRNFSRHPHIVLEREGRRFTSVSLFFRKSTTAVKTELPLLSRLRRLLPGGRRN